MNQSIPPRMQTVRVGRAFIISGRKKRSSIFWEKRKEKRSPGITALPDRETLRGKIYPICCMAGKFRIRIKKNGKSSMSTEGPVPVFIWMTRSSRRGIR